MQSRKSKEQSAERGFTMRKYSMEYYMMNDTTFYCPEWQNADMMETSQPVEGTESMSRIGRFFRELFG